jgi:hypothetical protein
MKRESQRGEFEIGFGAVLAIFIVCGALMAIFASSSSKISKEDYEALEKRVTALEIKLDMVKPKEKAANDAGK